MEQRYQVIIVGGGPVGVALAVELGQRGVSCVLIERHTTPQRIPKGQNLTNRSLEHFYFWGAVDELRAARVMPRGYPIGGITAYGDLMRDHWYIPVGRESYGDYFFQANERLPQYLTEEVLRARMADFPNVTSIPGWSAETIEQEEQGVRVTITEENGPGRQVFEAEYVVGCDGPRSTVREQSGIERDGTDFDQKMALLVFRSRELHEGLKHLPERTVYRALSPDFKGAWCFFGRIDVGEGWFFHAPVSRDATAEDYDFRGLLQRAAGFEFSVEFDHIGFWELRVAVANTYRKRRAFIAGDAAHTHPPYGAYGLNTGLEDVTNLGWKLAAALEGWGGDSLLDSYNEERRPIFWETGEDVIAGGIKRDRAFLEQYSPDRDLEEFKQAWKKVEAADSEVNRTYEPHYEGSSVVMGPPDSVCSIHGSLSLTTNAGHHLAPQLLSSGHNVFEELGSGFTLLAFDAEDSTVKDFEETAMSLNVPLKVVRDTYEDGRKKTESRLALVRPDQYVAWTGDTSPDDTARLMQKVTGIV